MVEHQLHGYDTPLGERSVIEGGRLVIDARGGKAAGADERFEYHAQWDRSGLLCELEDEASALAAKPEGQG